MLAHQLVCDAQNGVCTTLPLADNLGVKDVWSAAVSKATDVSKAVIATAKTSNMGLAVKQMITDGRTKDVMAEARGGLKSWINGYSEEEALVSHELSKDAYCGKETYLTKKWNGKAEGFVVTKVLEDFKHDLQGFVGYMPPKGKLQWFKNGSIYVVFRGSSSIRNWINDLDGLQENYTTWPECNCQVHRGYQKAINGVIADILQEVKTLKLLFPNARVKTTGHSLGAAQAHFTAMHLIKEGIETSMTNFGQPRIGCKNYADFSMKVFKDSYRVVHDRDIVPQLPPQADLLGKISYHHASYEMFENSQGKVRKCNASGEDITCQDRYLPWELNADDHCTYLGLPICSSCSTADSVFLQ